jgi:hypothetical protein
MGLRAPALPCRLFSMFCRMVVSRVARGAGGESDGGEVLVLSLSGTVACSHICWAAAWVASDASVSGGGATISFGGECEVAGD